MATVVKFNKPSDSQVFKATSITTYTEKMDYIISNATKQEGREYLDTFEYMFDGNT